MILQMYRIALQSFPYMVKMWWQFWVEKRNNFRKLKLKVYPDLETLMIIHTGTFLFNCDEYSNPVLNSVRVFIRQVLWEAKIRTTRDCLVAVRLCSDLMEYERKRERYCWELFGTLTGLILRSIPVGVLNKTQNDYMKFFKVGLC